MAPKNKRIDIKRLVEMGEHIAGNRIRKTFINITEYMIVF